MRSIAFLLPCLIELSIGLCRARSNFRGQSELHPSGAFIGLGKRALTGCSIRSVSQSMAPVTTAPVHMHGMLGSRTSLQPNTARMRKRRMLSPVSTAEADDMADSAQRDSSRFEVFSEPQPAMIRKGLPITGRVPAELIGGSYLRNGGNFARGESDSTLTFDGHGCIHRITLGADHADYSSTFVRTDAWKLEEELGQPVPRLSPRGVFEALRRGVRLGRANTNVLRWGTGLWATEESDAPVEIELDDSGVGIRTLRGGAAGGGSEGGKEATMRLLVSQLRENKLAFTGHPTVINDGGPPLLVGYGYSHEARWPICVYTVDADGVHPSCKELEGLLDGGLWATGWGRPFTIHNAAASRQALFLPISINPVGNPEWVRVPLPLDNAQPWTDLRCKRTRGFVGECVGAYRRSRSDEDVVLAFVHPPETAYGARLVQFTVRDGKLVDEQILWPERLFMTGCAAPTKSAEPPRFVYALGRSQDSVASGRTGMSGIDVLVKLDLVSGTLTEIRASDGFNEVVFGDPFFVPAATPVADDDGFLLSLRSDGTTGTTSLCIFDARSFSSTPMAVVELGVPIPHGAHSSFVPSAPKA